MEEYRPNSHKYKEEQRRAAERERPKKVINGKAKTAKRTLSQKLLDMIFFEDFREIKHHFIGDIAIPMLKKAFLEGVEMAFYGEVQRKSSKSSGTVTSYSKFYKEKAEEKERNARATRNGYEFERVTVSSRGEAQDILNAMDERIDQFGNVTVADMYDIAGLDIKEWTDNDWGWKNLELAEIKPLRNGDYVIEMPRARAL